MHIISTQMQNTAYQESIQLWNNDSDKSQTPLSQEVSIFLPEQKATTLQQLASQTQIKQDSTKVWPSTSITDSLSHSTPKLPTQLKNQLQSPLAYGKYLRMIRKTLISSYKRTNYTDSASDFCNSSTTPTKLTMYTAINVTQFAKLSSKMRFIQPQSNFPYSAVGLLLCTLKRRSAKQKTISATAFVFAKNYLVTSAHAVSEVTELSPQQTQIWFTPSAEPRVKYTSKRILYVQEYIEKQKIESFKPSQKFLYDYVLIQLNTSDNLEQKYGSFNHNFDWQHEGKDQLIEGQFLKFQKIIVLGYLEDAGQFKLAEFEGDALQSDNLLYSNLQTDKGSSGGPCLYRKNNQYWLIGIHIKRGRIGKISLPLNNQMHEHFQKHVTQPLNVIDLQNLRLRIDSIKPILDEAKNIFRLLDTAQIKRYINLSLNSLTPEEFLDLRDHLQNAETLDISNNRFSDEGCRFLAQNTYRGSKASSSNQPSESSQTIKQNMDLKRLFLYFNNINAKGCQYLASQPAWSSLEELKLSWNPIGPQGCRHLVKGPFINLKILFLSRCKIGVQGMKQLVNAPWKNIQEVYLLANNIGDEGCRLLVKAKWLYLRIINITNNKIGTLGCQYLSQAPWDELKELFMAVNEVDQQGVKRLASAKWPNLKLLGLHVNLIRDDPRHIFKAYNKKVQIEWSTKSSDNHITSGKSSSENSPQETTAELPAQGLTQ